MRGPQISTLFPYTTLFRSYRRSIQEVTYLARLGHFYAKHRAAVERHGLDLIDRKSTRLNSSHQINSYAVFCLKKKKEHANPAGARPPIPRLHACSAEPGAE